MRYQPTHKARTHQRILDRAAALFRREGYQGVGIDRIMSAAQLTRGGFYAHFKSKAALFAEVVAQDSDFAKRARATDDLREVISGYLAPENREKIGRGCTLASLTNEIPRRDAAAKRAFSKLVESLISEFEAHVPASIPDARARAVEAAALCVGGISLARGIGDEALAREVMDVCRDRACARIAPEAAPAAPNSDRVRR